MNGIQRILSTERTEALLEFLKKELKEEGATFFRGGGYKLSQDIH